MVKTGVNKFSHELTLRLRDHLRGAADAHRVGHEHGPSAPYACDDADEACCHARKSVACQPDAAHESAMRELALTRHGVRAVAAPGHDVRGEVDEHRELTPREGETPHAPIEQLDAHTREERPEHGRKPHVAQVGTDIGVWEAASGRRIRSPVLLAAGPRIGDAGDVQLVVCAIINT